jgi:hypothetical protein
VLRLLGLISVLCLISLFLGCGVVAGPQQQTYPVVVFSDIHFNPFDDPSLCPKLDAADITAWPGILQGSKISTKPAPWTKDTNYPLLTLALSGIQQNMGSSPVLIFTGDLLGHDFPGYYHADCGSSDPAAMQTFSIKTANFVMQQVRASLGNVPVMFVVGNSDSYLGLGPDSSFLAGTVQSYYTNFLMGSPAGYSDFHNTFANGGYYSTVPTPGLKVIGLNTNPFTPPYPGFPSQDTAVYSELAWLDTTLASAQSAGQKVWLLMHIPPGADTYTSATNFASGPLTATTAAMMWMPDYQQEFLRILAKFPGVITMTLAAHTHRDEFRSMSPGNALVITPSISPYFSNNPAFKVFTFASGTFTPVDYRSLNYDLAPMPAQFNPYYTFSQAYTLTGTLDSSFGQLYPQLVTNGVQRSTYIDHFNSGNNTVGATPITSANWPVFSCSISNMAQSDFIRCVNGY